MNARELADAIAEHASFEEDYLINKADDRAIILHALRLLAAAEENDGTTPETDAVGLTASEEAFPRRMTEHARRLERDRSGLAARVEELEPDAERLNWLEKNPRRSQIIVGDKTADCVFYGLATETLMPLRAAIDAARSKP